MEKAVLAGGLDVATDRVEIPIEGWRDRSQDEKNADAVRKAQQRARDAAQGVVVIEVRLAASEAAMLAEGREIRGFGGDPYTTTEYINTLLRRDHELLKQQQGVVAGRICEHCRKPLPRGCGGVWKGELPCVLRGYEQAMAL